MNLVSAAQSLTKFASKKIARGNAFRQIHSNPELFSVIPRGATRYRAALYFADGMVNAYQIRQWYEPLRQLSESIPLVVIVRNPRTAIALQKECPLPVYFARTIGDIENILESQQIDAVFYVNQNIRNFQMMRFNDPAHVFICHGESEKAYMWSNQLKAYDYVFSAGLAAQERLGKNLNRFDVQDRTRLVGRPQIDVDYDAPVTLNPSLPTVLYAPTWEGDRPSMRYGSVVSHGVDLIDSLVKDGGFNIIFRPHPRSGINDARYSEALKSLHARLDEADKTSSATLYYDDSPQWGWQWANSDLGITDISAVSYDYLATGKPLFITKPLSTEATVDDSPALLRVPGLSAADAAEAPRIIRDRLLSKDNSYNDLVEHYFGDTTRGASMQRFIDASLEIINETHVLNKEAGRA
ncbi:CDP-glycerol glycerophosphotransferase family protein [Glutamicibacter arilaitensis]|uniref:CDP-glycerol glycerophosphotransferase family protein n=1 Tax=Glutamicibacter arilaitensis TaxID=256701 RepID=UPI003FD4A4D1